ncbi:prepilin peptidase [Escherichia albertii]|uniref:A24 family peptidase n=1 Tax=Escherichia albertii TaxID=208962 RepID=UPI000CF5FB6B|nr:prepilin peptidase [Escherichia albertii]EFB5188742.1 tight adherance operon protein [Escherichia albertii]EJQ6145864.1 prepilin peptidase [Escherichia albertii]MCZ9127446.1 prepilin peptidase [Escherichia albertii]
MINISISLALLYCCYTDILRREITNWCVIFIFCCSLLSGVVNNDINIFLPLVVLFLGFICFSLGVIGAGDIKLLFALLVSLPENRWLDFFIFMGMIGGPLAICITIIINKIKKMKLEGIPFGVAICIGYLLSTWC